MYGDIGYAAGSAVVALCNLLNECPDIQCNSLYCATIEQFCEFFIAMKKDIIISHNRSGGSVSEHDFYRSICSCYNLYQCLMYVESRLFDEYSRVMKNMATFVAYAGDQKVANNILEIARKRTQLETRKRKIDCIPEHNHQLRFDKRVCVQYQY